MDTYHYKSLHIYSSRSPESTLFPNYLASSALVAVKFEKSLRVYSDVGFHQRKCICVQHMQMHTHTHWYYKNYIYIYIYLKNIFIFLYSISCYVYVFNVFVGIIHTRTPACRQTDRHTHTQTYKHTYKHTFIHSFVRSYIYIYIYICTYYRGLTFPMIEKNRLNIPQETHLQQSNVWSLVGPGMVCPK